MRAPGIRITLAITSVIVLTTAGASVSVIGGTSASAADELEAQRNCSLPRGVLEPADLPEGASVEECDAVGRVVDSGEGLAVKVPEPGTAVYGELAYPDAEAVGFGIEVTVEGDVSYETDSAQASLPGLDGAGALDEDLLGRVAAAPECSQNASHVFPFQQYGTFHWRMGDGPRPDGISSARFASVIEDSANNITRAFNNCGRADKVGITQVYDGTTSREAHTVNANGKVVCSAPDNVNTIDAGDLAGAAWDGAPLAVACFRSIDTHAGRDDIAEVDIRINTKDYGWTINPAAASCKSDPDPKRWRFDVESVLTHEFGHAFGLDHVSEKSYPRMTMSTATPPCDNTARTLGRGDMLALETLY